MQQDIGSASAAHDLALPPRTLTTWKVIVLIVGTMTPLSFFVALTPLALLAGGASFPLMLLVGGVVIGLFCVGYTRMVRQISRPGAYYSYVARGLGRPAGVGTAYVGVVTYVASYMALASVTAYTISSTLPGIGVFPNTAPDSLFPWVLIACTLLMGMIVWQQIDLSAIVSALVVSVELLLLFIFIAVATSKSGLDFDVVSSKAFDVGDWRVSLIYGVLIFQGFESGALYTPEARRPERTIPRALYFSLLLLTVSGALASWALISSVGSASVQGTVAELGPVAFVLVTVEGALGSFGLKVFSVVLIFAALVAALGATNFVARYLNGVAKDDLLPRPLASLNRHGAPGVAALTILGIGLVAAAVTAALGGAPYQELTPIGFGLAAIGTTFLVLLSNIAVIWFFRARPDADRNWWATATAPALSAVLIVACLGIEYWGFSYITGSSEAWLNYLPFLVLVVFVFGLCVAAWLRRNRPLIYRDIAAGDTAEAANAIRAQRLAATEEAKAHLQSEEPRPSGSPR